MLSFAKGHGTRNDFVCLTDPDNLVPLSAAAVRFLCDRRGGIGGDGVLRAVRGRYIDGWDGDPDVWFMDYRNADGSIAEMCGNGVRVFARYLLEEGLVDAATTPIVIGTRAGERSADLLPDGRVRVWMGRPHVDAEAVSIGLDARSDAATAVDVGNPHAVIELQNDGLRSGLDVLTDLDLTRAPRVPDTVFANGVNVEYVVSVAPHHARMRVHERGVGETQSCGTGTVAVAAALASKEGATEGTWRVDVPGGSVDVELRDGQAWLTGPAVIVARGQVRLPEEDE